MKKKSLLLGVGIGALVGALLCVLFDSFLDRERDYAAIMAVTGATPLAVKAEVGAGFTLEVSGLTKKVYRFGSLSLNAFAPVYLRTREVSPAGRFEGTYRYAGIPVLHLLEGVAPQKPADAAFDRPLDLVVTFVSRRGEKRHFSYGELTMIDDAGAALLAFRRDPLVPSSKDNVRPYEYNLHRQPLTGFRLVCPAEPDTARYLDDVVQIVLRDPGCAHPTLPKLRKGEKCVSPGVSVLSGDRLAPLTTAGLAEVTVTDWVRTGHGQGFKGISTASGYGLRGVLEANFPGCGREDWFLFVACDGYRALFSGREIFATEAGRRMMLIAAVDGRPRKSGLSLGPIADYFVDREIWGLTHIVRLDPSWPDREG